MVLFAVRLPIDTNLVLAILVNYLMYAFAFLYNDIEDRIEDAQSPGKRFKNPFGYKTLPLWSGYVTLVVIAVVSLGVSYYIGSNMVAAIAFSNLVAGLIYSMKGLRLKDYLIIDIATHGYLLAGVTMLYFMALPGAIVNTSTWLFLIALCLFSAGGDLLNERRDFEDDRNAGLRNTASFLGKQNTKYAQWLFWGVALIVGIIGMAGVAELISI